YHSVAQQRGLTPLLRPCSVRRHGFARATDGSAHPRRAGRRRGRPAGDRHGGGGRGVRAGTDGGALDGDRLAWVADRLAEDPAPTILAMHHPPVDTGILAMDEIGLPAA